MIRLVCWNYFASGTATFLTYNGIIYFTQRVNLLILFISSQNLSVCINIEIFPFGVLAFECLDEPGSKHYSRLSLLFFGHQHVAWDDSVVFWLDKEGTRVAFNSNVKHSMPRRLHLKISDSLEGFPYINDQKIRLRLNALILAVD